LLSFVFDASMVLEGLDRSFAGATALLNCTGEACEADSGYTAGFVAAAGTT